MAYSCIISNIEIPIVTFKHTIEENTIDVFDVTIPMRYVNSLSQSIYLLPITVLNDGILVTSGIIRTVRLYPTVNTGESEVATVTLKCDGELGRLNCEAGVIQHFQDELISNILTTLLAATTSSVWALNDISTLNDLTMTIDVRGMATLWAQIVKVCEDSNGPTYARYAGFSGGVHLIDFGSFGATQNEPAALLGENILEPPIYNEPTSEPLRVIIPVSGEASDTPVVLSDALNIIPTLSNPANPQYLDVVLQAIVSNVNANGCREVRSYPLQKTENDAAPTQSELDELALSLYRAAEADIISTEPHLEFEVMIASTVPPIISDAMYFESSLYERDYDIYTGDTNLIPTFSISGWYRVVKIERDSRERSSVMSFLTEKPLDGYDVYRITLTDGTKREIYNPTEIVYNKLRRADSFDKNISSVGVISVTNQSVNHNGVVGDCNFNGLGPNTGKEFVFPVPPPPAAATAVNVSIEITAGYLYAITQNAALATALELCVKPNTGNWGIGDNATVTVTYYFLN